MKKKIICFVIVMRGKINSAAEPINPVVHFEIPDIHVNDRYPRILRMYDYGNTGGKKSGWIVGMLDCWIVGRGVVWVFWFFCSFRRKSGVFPNTAEKFTPPFSKIFPSSITRLLPPPPSSLSQLSS